MKLGDLYWVFEGSKKVLERPAIYMGTFNGGTSGLRHLAVLQHDGRQRAFADYFYNFVKVENVNEGK